MRNVTLSIAMLACASTAFAQEFTVTLKSTEVVPSMFMLEGEGGFAGGNMTLLVGDDRIFLIDDGIWAIGPKLIELAAKLAGRPVDFVINTHVHSDHIGSNAALASDGTVVVAHDNIRKRLLEDSTDAGGPGGLPVVTFADAVTFYVNGHEAFVFHIAAAHTDGDAVIHFRDLNIIHAGDIHFNYLFPFIDLDTGGSVAGFLAGQRRMLALADDETVIIPGHGPLASKADLQAAVDMLADSQARVAALVDQGMSDEDIVAANPLALYHDEWNWSFITTERMTRTLIRSMTAEQAE